MDEKQPPGEQQNPHLDRADDAVVYLDGHANSADGPQVDLRALRRKIDLRLMPYMFCCYILQFLDKVMLNVRSVFGCEPLQILPLMCRFHSVCGRYGNQKRFEPCWK